MWTLLLSRVEDPGTYIDRRQIDGGQIKIGRAIDRCDWVIPDPDGYVSREHCTILVSGLDLYVIDTSSYGTVLNGGSVPIAQHQPVSIRVTDRLTLGDFVVEVAPEGAMAGAPLPAPPPQSPSGGGGLGGDQWFEPVSDPIWASSSRDSDIHEFLGGSFDEFMAVPPPPARRDTGEAFGAVGMGAAFSKPIMAPMDAANVDFGIPEDWDLPPPAPKPMPAPTSIAAPSSPSPLVPHRAPAQSDPFALDTPRFGAFDGDPFRSATGDPFPLDAFAPGRAWDAEPASQPVPFAAPDDADPFADVFGETPAGPVAPLFEPDPEPAPEAIPHVTPPPAAVAPPRGGGEPDWAAFCEGAGIDPEDLRRSPDAMRRLGVLYRQVVLGLSDLIQDRAAFKSEFRLGVTTLAVGRNNPLKMLGPLDTAKVMLADPLPGFMSSDEAVRSAFEDIKKHQMAMLAGVQHALTAVFKRLAPSEIETLLEKAASERRGLPFRRSVDPWTVYQAVFDALRTDATSNTNSVMSVAFREGYEAFLKSEPART